MPGDPSKTGVRFQQCLDKDGNHLGWLKLVEAKMTAEEFAREMEYLADHPYYKSEEFLKASESLEGPPREYRSHGIE